MADAQPVSRVVEVHDHVDVSRMGAPTDQELIDFVIREARLIDEHRLDEWLELFAEDGIYWMPLEWGQTDPKLTASLMYEDKLLLTIRIERLKGNRTFSQKPRSRCHHVLQMPQIDKRDEAGNEYLTYTPMHYVETAQEGLKVDANQWVNVGRLYGPDGKRCARCRPALRPCRR